MDPRDDDSRSLAEVEPIMRRVIARSAPAGQVDDLVQDALERVIAARQRLTPESLAAYSVVVARSVVAGEHRRAERQRRHEPALADLRQPELPDAPVLAEEDHHAMRVALRCLPAADRDTLLRHDVDGTGLATLAHEAASTPGALAVRLSRSRARLRVEYMLSDRRVRLPTPQCHPVLLALSAGDRRRQQRLAADAHLLSCPSCAGLAPALLERRRGLASFIPLAGGLGGLRRWLSKHPKQAAAGASTAALVAVAVAMTQTLPGTPEPPPAAVSACPELDIAGRGAPTAASELVGRIGQPAAGRSVIVESVPSNEGFWIRCGPLRLWVQLVGQGESNPTIQAGTRVTFNGTIVGHDASFPEQVGVTPAEGAGQLANDRIHVETAANALIATP